MNQVIAQKWADALRSGEYVQNNEGPLRSIDGYSSLGVLGELVETPNCPNQIIFSGKLFPKLPQLLSQNGRDYNRD